MSEFQLTTELLKLSKSSRWDEAKLEWEVIDIHRADEPETCLCGHFPIIEVCTIENIHTKNVARVGNCCVKKFNDRSGKIFQAVNRIRGDQEKSVNSETLELAVKNSWISHRDYKFYIDILRKRKLSEKQLKWKMNINARIVYWVKKNKPRR